MCECVCVSECLLSTLEICLLCANVRKAQRVVAGAKPTLAYLMPPVNTRSACLAWPACLLEHVFFARNCRGMKRAEGVKNKRQLQLVNLLFGTLHYTDNQRLFGPPSSSEARKGKIFKRRIPFCPTPAYHVASLLSLPLPSTCFNTHMNFQLKEFSIHIFSTLWARDCQRRQRFSLLFGTFCFVFLFLTALLAWKLTTREACPHKKVCLVVPHTLRVIWPSSSSCNKHSTLATIRHLTTCQRLQFNHLTIKIKHFKSRDADRRKIEIDREWEGEREIEKDRERLFFTMHTNGAVFVWRDLLPGNRQYPH